jgi:hypothetical protein
MFVRIVFASFLMMSTAALAQTPFNHPCPDHTVPDRTVTICTPTQSAQVPLSFFIVAHITDSLSFTAHVLIDDAPLGDPVSASEVNGLFGIGLPGPHRITVKVQDSSGTFESSILVNSISGQTPCAAGPTNRTITICTPQDGDQETSPVELAAVTTDSNFLDATQVYVDGVKAKEGLGRDANNVLTHVLLEPGPHRITFQAIEGSGLIIRKTIHISVR